MLTINGQMELLKDLRLVVDYVYDGVPEAFNILYYIKGNYKEWPKMIIWLKKNDIRGQKLVDFFKHESPDNGGYLHGCMLILSRMNGNKTGLTGVKISDLN